MMNEFQEYDSVKTRKDIPLNENESTIFVSDCIPAGADGVVLIVHGDSDYYEVEFFDKTKRTIAVKTIAGTDLELKNRYEK